MNRASSTEFKGKLLFDEPMSRHTSWRLGGPADRYYQPTDLVDLQNFLSSQAEAGEILWVGLGSNLLVRDAGIRGLVIAPLNGLKEIYIKPEGRVYVECGVSCAKLAKFCQKQGLAGADFFAGIPGTVGGALAMNAGAFGGETWSSVERLTMIDKQGRLTERNASEFQVDYRKVSYGTDEWFAAAEFHFEAISEAETSNIRQLLQRRNQSQPIGQPSCGSVFKNPPGGFAADLIERAGFKGYCLDDACVSEKHANFIISNAATTASSVEALIAHIQQSISDQFGISLQTEVRIVGEAL
jgi:UDP-N-acetylmuramate dehydrogenase